ncbi:MAG TPA: hypothetical protein VGM23_07345, partial [Armatimonadota bacterium]
LLQRFDDKWGARNLDDLQGDPVMNHTWPIKVDQNWKILVTAEKETSSLWVGRLHEENISKPGSYPSAPPFIASRAYGQGAIVLVGISPFELFMGQGLPAYGNYLLEKGNGQIPSDTGRLYSNTMNWLGARALAVTGAPTRYTAWSARTPRSPTARPPRKRSSLRPRRWG